MKQDSRLYVTAELKNLAVIRDFVENSCASLEIEDNLHYDIVLAVEEIVTNIIVHGYKYSPGPVEIIISRESGSVVIQINDQAQPFDPTSLSPPDITLPLENRPVGGLGVFLTRQLVDEIFYDLSPEGHNQLTMIKES